ncbi:mitochondrial ribosomal protein L48 isoform X2 [Tachypleus tridentatus]|uniref:mitochondrial ribosomal protein L48 isoform X2 n=1 Tax=Tachypleus tridentatus TaxID=6853 RepID=UPI003FD1EC13
MMFVRNCCLLHSVYRASMFTMQHSKSLSHEPEYLELLKPPVPLYDVLDVQVKGYDFAVVEQFAKYVHNIALKMDIEVEDSWATPSQSLHVTNFKPESTVVENSYHLNIYERNVQVSGLSATIAPTFLEVIQKSLPEGVNFCVQLHQQEFEEMRYIPDLQLEDFKRQLDEIKNPKTQAGKKK